MDKIRIYLQSYDHKLLDQSAKKIAEVVKKNGSEVAGPLPLPTKTKKYTVLRSVHVNKDSREQFKMRKYFCYSLPSRCSVYFCSFKII